MQRYAILTLGATLLCSGTARAQIGAYSQPQWNPRPPVSPYLNMFRNNAAMNYYGIVRPQIDTARQLQMLQQEVASAPQGGVVLPIDPLANNILTFTGHPVSFQNYSHFYGGRGGSNRSPGVAGGTGNPIGRANPSSISSRPIIVGTTVNRD